MTTNRPDEPGKPCGKATTADTAALADTRALPHQKFRLSTRVPKTDPALDTPGKRIAASWCRLHLTLGPHPHDP
jgi:hypothetical protein